MRIDYRNSMDEIIKSVEDAMYDYFENFVEHCACQLETLLKIASELDQFQKESQFFNLKMYQREIKSGIASYQKLKSAFQRRDPLMRNTDIIDQLISRDKIMLATAFFRADFDVDKLKINVRNFKNRAKLFLLGVAEILAGATGMVASALFLMISAPTIAGVFVGGLGMVASVSVAAKGAFNIKNALSKTSDAEKKKEAEVIENERSRIESLRKQPFSFTDSKLSR